MWEAKWGGKVYLSHGSSHSKGVMTLVNPNLDVKVEKYIQDTKGRFLILDLLIDELHLILVNIYARMTQNSKSRFLKNSKISLKILPKRILLSQVTLTALCLKMTKKVEIQFGKNP